MIFTPRHQQTNIWPTTGRKILTVVVLSGLLVGVVVYLSLINNVAIKGYEIKELQSILAQVKIDKQLLETEVASKQFTTNQAEYIKPEGFVAVEKIEYLSAVPQAGVAIK